MTVPTFNIKVTIENGERITSMMIGEGEERGKQPETIRQRYFSSSDSPETESDEPPRGARRSRRHVNIQKGQLVSLGSNADEDMEIFTSTPQHHQTSRVCSSKLMPPERPHLIKRCSKVKKKRERCVLNEVQIQRVIMGVLDSKIRYCQYDRAEHKDLSARISVEIRQRLREICNGGGGGGGGDGGGVVVFPVA